MGLLLFFGQDKIELPDDDWISHFAFSLIQFGPLVALVTIFGNNRLNAALATLLIILFWMIIIERQLSYQYEGVQFANDIGFFTTLLLPVILLSVAPAKAISRRLIFLALGLLLLIGLNELSKLGLDLTAPKVQG
jgi:hypothetical protein